MFRQHEHYDVYVHRPGSLPVKLKAPPGHFYADPFLLLAESKLLVFVEDYSHAERMGRLACLELSPDGLSISAYTAIIDEPFHQSFPCILKHEGRIFLLPERRANGTIDLFEMGSSPAEWRHRKRILSNIDAVDSVLFHQDGLWWLITMAADRKGEPRHLRIYTSEDLLESAFEPHPANGLRLHAGQSHGSGRNGGPVIRFSNTLLRVAQKSSRFYGEGLELLEITKLNEVEYAEAPWPGKCRASSIIEEHSPHHLCELEGIFAWDVRVRS